MERPSYVPFAPATELPKYIGEQNLRFLRWADLIARLQQFNYRTVTAATTITEADDYVAGNTNGGNFTITLPLASTVPGRRFEVKKVDAANTLTLAAAGSDTIDGSASVAWTTDGQSYSVLSVNTAPGTYNWKIV